MNDLPYVGNELELFQNANNWKKYFGSFIKPYLHGKVLEVGAGIGGTTRSLCDGSQERWDCLEPDVELAERISRLIATHALPACCNVITGTLEDIPESEKYEAIMYIDVIEHIEKDNQELELASKYLSPNGVIIVVVPAHQWLYSPFDASIGHYRRYTRKSLLKVPPPRLESVGIYYLDSVGLMLSLGNKLILKTSMPSIKQIQFWDKVIVRVSRLTDALFRYSLGKSLLVIWKNNN